MSPVKKPESLRLCWIWTLLWTHAAAAPQVLRHWGFLETILPAKADVRPLGSWKANSGSPLWGTWESAVASQVLSERWPSPSGLTGDLLCAFPHYYAAGQNSCVEAFLKSILFFNFVIYFLNIYLFSLYIYYIFIFFYWICSLALWLAK